MAIMLLASARASAPRAFIPTQIGAAIATFATAAGIWKDEMRGATRVRIIEFGYGVVKVFYRNRGRGWGRVLDRTESPALDVCTRRDDAPVQTDRARQRDRFARDRDRRPVFAARSARSRSTSASARSRWARSCSFAAHSASASVG